MGSETLILGGGLAGLAAGWALTQAGRRVQVLEGGSTVGGLALVKLSTPLHTLGPFVPFVLTRQNKGVFSGRSTVLRYIDPAAVAFTTVDGNRLFVDTWIV